MRHYLSPESELARASCFGFGKGRNDRSHRLGESGKGNCFEMVGLKCLISPDGETSSTRLMTKDQILALKDHSALVVAKAKRGSVAQPLENVSVYEHHSRSRAV